MRAIWIISPIIAIGLATSAPAQGVGQNAKQQIDQIIAAFTMLGTAITQPG